MNIPKKKITFLIFIILFFIYIPISKAIDISLKGEYSYEYLKIHDLVMKNIRDKIILANNQGSFVTVIYPDKKINSYSFLKLPEFKKYDEVNLNNSCVTYNDKIIFSLAAGKTYDNYYNGFTSIVDLDKGFKPILLKEKFIDQQNFVYIEKNRIRSLCTGVERNITNKSLTLLNSKANTYLTFSPDMNSLFIQEQTGHLITWNLYNRNKSGEYLKINHFVMNNKIDKDAYLFVKWAIDSSYIILSNDNKTFIINNKNLVSLNLGGLGINPESIICLANKFYFIGSQKVLNNSDKSFVVKYDIKNNKFEKIGYNKPVAITQFNNNKEILVADIIKQTEKISSFEFKKIK